MIETRALDELLPNWKADGAPLNQAATSDSMRFLTENASFPLPHPPQMNNKGNYIVSLSRFTAWLGEQAEAAGVEVYPGFAGARVLYTEDGKGVKGVATGDVGLDKDGQPKESYEPGMEFHAKCTLIAEGAHGSLSKTLQNRFNLRDGKDPQTYGIGIKEVWKVREEVHQPGKVVHTLGWPLDFKTYGGSWCYHMEDRMVSLGLVVGLDYENPYLSPYKEFQVGRVAAARLLWLMRRDTAHETPPRLQGAARGRRVHRVWRARAQRGWSAVRAQARFPRRRAHRLLCRLPQRAQGVHRAGSRVDPFLTTSCPADQGHAQRHEIGHARRRGSVRGHLRPARGCRGRDDRAA